MTSSTLKDYLAKGTIVESDKLRIARQVAQGMLYLYQQDPRFTLHQSFNCSNILLLFISLYLFDPPHMFSSERAKKRRSPTTA